jgi:hypothetical protein
VERKKLFISARDIRDIAHERQVLDNASFCLQALASCMAIPPMALSPRAIESRIGEKFRGHSNSNKESANKDSDEGSNKFSRIG